MFFRCRCPSRPASWPTIASVVTISFLIDCLSYNYLLSLDPKSVSFRFLSFLVLQTVFFVQILLRVPSASIMCQFILSILPACIVVLSYRITNGRFFSCVFVFVLLGNSKSACEKFLISSNCFLTSERLNPLLIRLFLSVVSFHLVPHSQLLFFFISELGCI